jgi:hypothetical protein
MQTAGTAVAHTAGAFDTCHQSGARATLLINSQTSCTHVVVWRSRFLWLEQISWQPRRQQHAAVHRRPQVAMRAAAETIPTGDTDVAEGDTYEVDVQVPQQSSGCQRCVAFGSHCISKCGHTASEPASSLYPQVNIEKPMGIRFARGNDGAAYVLKSDPRSGNTDDRVEVTDVWQMIS